jgi:hypothetical protein
MKKMLFILLSLVSLTLQGQTNKPHWYGYPHDRQVSALLGGLTGVMFYSVARANMPNDTKFKSILVSTGGTLFTSSVMALMPNQTPIERRQNFTASFLSGVSITLIFSLGI